MAGLNLNPNPIIMVTQAGFFFASLITVKKLMLDPYLKIRDSRLASTKGSQSDSKEIIKDNETKERSIEEKMTTGIEEARHFSEDIRNKAKTQRDQILADAQEKSRELIKASEAKLKETLNQETSKISNVISEITDVLYNKTLN